MSICRFSNIEDEVNSNDLEQVNYDKHSSESESISISPDFHYNIQIHLPATTDISVYNAIFKSIRENLFK